MAPIWVRQKKMGSCGGGLQSGKVLLISDKNRWSYSRCKISKFQNGLFLDRYIHEMKSKFKNRLPTICAGGIELQKTMST